MNDCETANREPWVTIAADSAGRRRRGSENRGSVVLVVVVVVAVVDKNRIQSRAMLGIYIYTLPVVGREKEEKSK